MYSHLLSHHPFEPAWDTAHMTDQKLTAEDDRFHGTVIGKELLDLLKMLHRICASGVLHLDADVNRASLCLDGGNIRAAFFNDLLGNQALTRIILIGRAVFRFELATAHTVAGYAKNIQKDTALILTVVEKMLADVEDMPQEPVVDEPIAQQIITAPLTETKITEKIDTYKKIAIEPNKAESQKDEQGSLVHGSLVVENTGPTSQKSAPVAEQSAFFGEAFSPTASLSPSEDDKYSNDVSTIRVTSFLPPEPGAVFGKCELMNEIGRGASSIVFLAHHCSLDLQVVLKVLMPDGANADSHRLLTINEARLLARLNHPNILRVFDFTEVGRWPHIITELVDGQTMTKLIRDRRTLSTDIALPLICQAAEALSYAHTTMGVVHCDIKPDNILLTKDLLVKIADFGLSKSKIALAAVDTAFPVGTVAGTPSYIAPEQVQGGRPACDHRSDIYSLGATLYHAVTGRTPFSDPNPVQLMVKRLSESPIPPHLVNPKVERRVSQLIMSMMARDPNNRIQSWEELLELMGDILDTLAPATDRYRSETNADGNIIRRRTSFWNYVPNRLFRRTSTDQKDVG